MKRRSKTKCVYFSRAYEGKGSWCNYRSPSSLSCLGVCPRYKSYEQEARERKERGLLP